MKKWVFYIILGVFAFVLGRKVNEVIGFFNNNLFANVIIDSKGDTLLQSERTFLNTGCYSEFEDLKKYYSLTNFPTDSEFLLSAIIAANLYHTDRAGNSVFKMLVSNDIYDFNSDWEKLNAYCLMREIGEDYLRRSACDNDYNSMLSILNEKSCNRDFFDPMLDSLARKFDDGYLVRKNDTVYLRTMQLHKSIHNSK